MKVMSLPVAPQASYISPQVYRENQPIPPLVPAISGSATSFSVTPSLPAGLVLDVTTGTISGKPAAVAATADYTITVNAGRLFCTIGRVRERGLCLLLTFALTSITPAIINYSSVDI